MLLLLMRHGKAERLAATDFDRRLTAKGAAKVRQGADKLRTRGIQVEKILVSPYIRAMQTAEIMAEECGVAPLEVSEAIIPAAAPAAAAAAMAQAFTGCGSGLAVMHEPIISRLLFHLAGADCPMATSGLAVLETELIGPAAMTFGPAELKCVL